MRKGMNNKQLGSRFIAFFVMCAMMLSMWTPVVWADSGTLKGDIYMENLTDQQLITEINTGTDFVVVPEFEVGQGTVTPRIYLNCSLDDIVLVNFDKNAVGGTYSGNNITYTICQDEEGSYYLEVTGLEAGYINSLPFTVRFNAEVLPGTPLTMTICNGNTKIEAETGKNSSYTVYAVADLEWGNTKTTSNSAIHVKQGETHPDSDIVYTIKEASKAELTNTAVKNEDGSLELASGEAVLQSYTAKDTILLEGGVYINASSATTPEEAIKAAYGILDDTNTPVSYTVSDIVYAEDSGTQIIGFTASWEVKNPGAGADGVSYTPMSQDTYTATLKKESITVLSGFAVGNVTNSISTDYITKKYDENGKVVDVPHTVPEVKATTTISQDGSPIETASKKVKSFEGFYKASINWLGAVEGYVVKDDKIEYEIAIQNATSETLIYTVTDDLSAAGLTYDSFRYANNATVEVVEGSNVTFNVTVNANTTAYIYFYATVAGEDASGIITNKATISITDSDGKTSELDVTAEDVPKQEKAPDFSVEKYVEGLDDGNIYRAKDPFWYVIKVTNTGTGAAESISFEDILPEGVTYADAYEITEGDEITIADDGKTVTGTVKNIEAAASRTVKIKVTADADYTGNTIVNTASATLGEDTKEASTSIIKNSATVENLTISKTASDKFVAAGETVTYTVTVHNPNSKGTLYDDMYTAFYVEEVLPAGMEYVSVSDKLTDGTGSVTKVNTEGNPVFEISGADISNNGSVSFTVVCRVTDAAAANTALENIVNLKPTQDGAATATGSHTGVIKADENSTAAVSVEKHAYASDGTTLLDDTVIEPGTEVTFRIKITNNSTQNLQEFTVSDIMTGNFTSDAIWIKLYGTSGSDVILFKGTNWDGNSNGYYTTGELLFGGNAITNALQFDLNFVTYDGNNFWNGWSYLYSGLTYSGLTIPPSGWIEIGYTVTAKAAQGTWDTFFTSGSNEVAVDAGDLGMDYARVDFPAAETTDPDEPTEPDEPVETSNQLSMTKTAVDNALSADSSTAAESSKYTYTVTLKNESTESYTIKANDAVFTDVIPGGMALDCEVSGEYNEAEKDALVRIQHFNAAQDAWTNHASEDSWANNSKPDALVSIKQGDTEISITSGKYTTQEKLDGYVLRPDPVNRPDYVEKYNLKTKIDADTLNLSFTEDIVLAAGESLKLTYTLVPSDTEVAAIAGEIADNGSFADRTYRNEMTFNAGTGENFKNPSGEVVSTITAAEDVHLVYPKIHPGIDKDILYDVKPGDTSLKYYSDVNTLPQLSDTFIWKVTVYNGKDINDSGAVMENYTVSEAYPNYYAYAGTTCDYNEVWKNNERVSYSTYTAEATIYRANGSVVSGLGPVMPDGNVFTFNGETYKLNPGDRLEFTVITKPQAGAMPEYGLYTNTVKLGNVSFDKSNVVAGTANEACTEITASETIALYLVNTVSEKTVTLTKDDGTVLTASSASSATENRIAAEMGDTVRYALKVTNRDADDILEDFTIIDRLPYSGDVGVISDIERGSVFPLAYAGNAVATITYNNVDYTIPAACLDISYSSSVSGTFEGTDLDWVQRSSSSSVARGATTRVAWSKTPSSSTNLIRFAFVNWDKIADSALKAACTKVYTDESGLSYTKYGIPSKATVTIEFDAKVPEYVQNVGEGNIAWNSFGYYFNSGEYENMIAEPAKVGVWVDDENFGGAILLRKNYITNIPAESTTFYFALYDGRLGLDADAKQVDTASITMTGSETGAYATTYFTDIDYMNSAHNGYYYIYETDSSGNPLVADASGLEWEERTFYPKDENGNDIKSKGQSIKVVVSKTATVNGHEVVMDNESQIEAAFAKYSVDECNEELKVYNSEYLVWHKDINRNKTYNSAIFTNTYIADVEKTIMGPFYADVPKAQEYADSYMTSTRPDSFKAGAIEEKQTSNTRTSTYAGYGDGTSYGNVNKYGGAENHTIATGFLARVRAVGNYTIEQVKWTIQTSVPSKSETGVYIRLKTVETSGLSLMYLNDFDVYEDESEGSLSLGAASGFEDISDDESFLSDYTVEERAALVAEGLGIDPANIEYDEYGQPYVVMDEELQSEAFAFSEASSDITANDLNREMRLPFEDSDMGDGYVIYKLTGDTSFVMQFNDNLPHITLEAGGEAFIGIIVDQLYDRDATVDPDTGLVVSDIADYDNSEMLELTSKADGKLYTSVSSPYQRGNFTLGALYKLTAGTKYTFDGFGSETFTSTTNVQNVNNTVKVTATSAKSVTINKRDADSISYYGWTSEGIIGEAKYSSYVSLGGTGTKDYRSIVVNVPAGATLRLIAKSSGSSTRTLVIEESPVITQDENGDDVETIEKHTVTVPGKSATGTDATEILTSQEILITNGGAVYIYSAGSGIDVYSIEIAE